MHTGPWEKNIAKLAARYGDKFCDVKVYNRDLDKEKAAMAAVNANRDSVSDGAVKARETVEIASHDAGELPAVLSRPAVSGLG
jgi:hypothetical protein